MKKIFLTLILITVYFLKSYAQTNHATWVIESESPKAKMQTVKFYDDNSQIIYTETINARLNISKKKVQKALNQILDSLLTQQYYRENKSVLAASFKLKP
ncbi:hypothetical protein ABDD95_16660 [Mucilaginibacter sp. PAMB04274]|uniref:hypothetical protein n=1 Tax=Mucilaginibacter sp. PAMB04274 TaxID=3138568 RepID=UPI0031F64B8B